jgi:ABC-2 type transport system ATP-binding protein
MKPVSRLVATAGLLLLGGVALSRLPMEYLPRRSFPELTVALSLPEAREPAAVGRDWVEEIEGAVRSLGRLRGTAGEVRSDGAQLTVRFTPGTDAERKAARLESELAGLRRRLPAGARLTIDPAAQTEGELLALVWLSGVQSDADAEAAAEELRGVPGVRQVDALGVRREEVRVELAAGTLDPGGTAAAVRAAIDRALRRPELGHVIRGGDRRLPLIVPQQPLAALARLPVPLPGGGAAPLGALASVRSRWPEPAFRVRYQGKPARALFVYRATGAPLLATDRALRRRLDAWTGTESGIRGTVDWSEAAPLRNLLARLALGGLLASLIAAALGLRLSGRRGALALGFALPASVAAAANALWLAGVPLHVTTLAALALGATAALAGAALRVGRPRGRGFPAFAATAIAAAAAVPIAVALAGDELGPLLAEPARAFLLATAAAVLAAAILPASDRPDRTRSTPVLRGLRGPRALQRRALRDPGTTALTLFTAAAVTAALCGPALVPKAGDLSPDGGSFTVRLRLAEGATLAETERQVKAVEEQLAKAGEVERFWSSAWAGRALLRVEVRSADRRIDRLTRLATRVRYQIPAAAAARIDTGAGAAGGQALALDLEDHAKADDEAHLYRFVLRSADLGALGAAYQRTLERLEGLKVRRFWIDGWGDPSLLLSLHPIPGAPGAAPLDIAELARALARESSAPVPLPLPPLAAGGGERSLVVVPAGAPADPDRAVPTLAALLGRPLRTGDRTVTPAAALAVRRDAVHPRIARQSGRFVLPVEIQLPMNSEELRRTFRRGIDRALAQLRLPAGVDLERPELGLHLWDPERARLWALALAVPLLLFAVAACRLGSPLRALVALVPLAAGLLAAAPFVQATLGQVDELTVFALMASLALALPLAAEVTGGAGGAGGIRESGAALYRGLRRETPWLLAALVPAVLALAAPTLGADLIRFRWVVPLRAAALAGAAALLAAAVAVPALRLAAARWRERDPEEARRRRLPPVWSAPGAPLLTVRSVTKTYASGHTALHGVGFELGPGITGLLGPNGAGKTTLLRILTGLLEPTRGSVSFRGVPVTPDDLAAYRVRIGFLPQEFNAYPDFTAAQFLEHWALERGMDDARARRAEIERLLAAVGLAEHAGRKVRDFSGGMRQRVGIARALLGTPPILIVDEPTTGLDIESRGRFRQILLEQAADRVVLFSTHIASDVEAAASRILLLHRGRLRFDGPPEELVERARGQVFAALVADADLPAFGRRYRVTARVRLLEGIHVRAVARPGDEPSGHLVEPNLEEAYLAEIERADAASGQTRTEETFSFLDRGAA